MSEPGVYCLGLSPALQRTAVLSNLAVGEVNRAGAVYESAAGKAVNTAQALAVLGVPALAAGFNGGETGGRLAAYLRKRGVAEDFTPISASTRICTTLFDVRTRAATEIVEEAPHVDGAGLKAFAQQALSRIAEAPALALSGTLPPSVPSGFYAQFIEAATVRGIPALIDSHAAPLLETLRYRPLVVKMNVAELAKTLAATLDCEDAVLRSIRDLQRLGARCVFITQGASPAYLIAGDGAAWRLAPPELHRRLNPIGSGDCASAGFIAALLRGGAMHEAAAFAIACGSANAETYTPADFTADEAARLLPLVGVERIK